ncbi:hypothetical protein [Streptacidiphilus fuscans]|uniref:Uncharacterized protein n=1 Tax=Streptacidiphilus fuscans TaxID=2789292 RepID=A0A931BAF0_9ACTN|nr:hypothetical protein [Streptacidiphilus fuscans]MBF9072532.1 hypothetical protein [Streptacidiphilus fuscans]
MPGAPINNPRSHPKPPPYQPKQYGNGTSVPNGHGSYSNPQPFTPPPVPSGGDGGKGTTVDTPSLDLFADNIDQLVDPVRKAQTALEGVSVEPGDFYHANKMRIDVTGPNADAGLKEQFVKVLGDLSQGLSDLSAGVRQLSAKYKTIEDANSASATDLQNAFQSTDGDFTSLITDAGGTPGAPPSGGNSS